MLAAALRSAWSAVQVFAGNEAAQVPVTVPVALEKITPKSDVK